MEKFVASVGVKFIFSNKTFSTMSQIEGFKPVPGVPNAFEPLNEADKDFFKMAERSIITSATLPSGVEVPMDKGDGKHWRIEKGLMIYK